VLCRIRPTYDSVVFYAPSIMKIVFGIRWKNAPVHMPLNESVQFKRMHNQVSLTELGD
jgi:hypothetical protein